MSVRASAVPGQGSREANWGERPSISSCRAAFVCKMVMKQAERRRLLSRTNAVIGSQSRLLAASSTISSRQYHAMCSRQLSNVHRTIGRFNSPCNTGNDSSDVALSADTKMSGRGAGMMQFLLMEHRGGSDGTRFVTSKGAMVGRVVDFEGLEFDAQTLQLVPSEQKAHPD